MNHNVNANKMVSDTPRTDEAVWDEHDPFAAVGHLCRTMERELAAVTQERDALAARVKRLEEAGDKMADLLLWQSRTDRITSPSALAWHKAKESKL